MLRYVPCRVLVLFMTNGCEQEGLGLVCPYLNPRVTQCGPTAAYTQLVLSVSGPSLSKILYCCCCSCCSNANMITMETYCLPQQHVCWASDKACYALFEWDGSRGSHACESALRFW